MPGPIRSLSVEFNESTADYNAGSGTYTLTASLCSQLLTVWHLTEI